MVNRTNRYRNDGGCGCNVNASNNGNGGCGGCNSNDNGACRSNSQSQLMNKLRKIDFALVDTILYLDAYPHCKTAMEYYKKLLSERKMILEKLEANGIPLTAMSNYSDSWNWTDSPWPWEYDANV